MIRHQIVRQPLLLLLLLLVAARFLQRRHPRQSLQSSPRRRQSPHSPLIRPFDQQLPLVGPPVPRVDILPFHTENSELTCNAWACMSWLINGFCGAGGLIWANWANNWGGICPFGGRIKADSPAGAADGGEVGADDAGVDCCCAWSRCWYKAAACGFIAAAAAAAWGLMPPFMPCS